MGSKPKLVISLGFKTSEILLWDSTTATSEIPDMICIHAVANPIIPSDEMVHSGRRTAPNWSGIYSSVMLIPSQKSSVQQTQLCTSFRGSIPASSYARLDASNINSRVESPGVMESKP